MLALERDIPQLGPRIPCGDTPPVLDHAGAPARGLLNAAALARALAVDGKTVASYLELLVDLLLVRRLSPWHGNVRKRLIKSPKVYVRDSGLVHALLGIGDREMLLSHPVVAATWEGMAIESLIAAAPDGTEAHFFRTAAGAEIDLLLKLPGRREPVRRALRGLSYDVVLHKVATSPITVPVAEFRQARSGSHASAARPSRRTPRRPRT